VTRARIETLAMRLGIAAVSGTFMHAKCPCGSEGWHFVTIDEQVAARVESALIFRSCVCCDSTVALATAVDA
jgi:hypothetical protein